MSRLPWVGLAGLGVAASLTACQFSRPPDVEGEAGPPRRTLTVMADGPGTVTSQPAGINCAGDTCTAQFDDGATVNLTAQANGGAIFSTFGGACAGPQPTCAIAMTEDRTVTATFAAFQCTPNTTTCTQQQLVVCDGSGAAQVTPCLFGCHPSGTRCYDLAPSNVGMAACLDASAVEPDATIADGSTINTDDGTIRTAGGTPINVASETIAAPTDGVAVRCFRVNKLTIGQTTVVGARALAIAANGDVSITGQLSVSARAFDQPGPGTYRVDAGCAGGPGTVAGFLHTGGGGGGGFGTSGGPGGSGGGTATAGTAGPSNGAATLIPLRGGCRGGVVPASTAYNGAGAIQIASRGTISLSSTGGISANGVGGGREGMPGPWGGGSGGGVLLEAASLSVSNGGFLVANGGGGAGVSKGEDGRLDAMYAAGGPAQTVGTLYGSGGRGAAGAFVALAGESVSGGVGGGGGGGVGRVRINTYQAFAPPPAAVVSPPPSLASTDRR